MKTPERPRWKACGVLALRLPPELHRADCCALIAHGRWLISLSSQKGLKVVGLILNALGLVLKADVLGQALLPYLLDARVHTAFPGRLSTLRGLVSHHRTLGPSGIFLGVDRDRALRS